MLKKLEKYGLWIAVAAAVVAAYYWWWIPRQQTAAVNASIAAKNAMTVLG